MDSTNNENNGESEKNESPPIPTLSVDENQITVKDTGKCYDKTKATENSFKSWRKDSTVNKASVLVNATIGMCTIAIVVFSVLQYRLSKDSSEKQLRAYVIFDQTKIDNVFNAETQIKNTGQTPAYNVTTYCTLAVSANANLVCPFALDTVKYFIDSVFGQPSIISFPSVIESDGGNNWQVVHGLSNIYLWGIVSYDDVFQKHHITQMFGRFNFYNLQTSNINFQQIGKYNNAN